MYVLSYGQQILLPAYTFSVSGKTTILFKCAVSRYYQWILSVAIAQMICHCRAKFIFIKLDSLKKNLKIHVGPPAKEQPLYLQPPIDKS